MIRKLFLLFILGSFLSFSYQSCGATKPSTKGSTSVSSPSLRQQIIADAEALVGTRYKYGGINPRSGMDCSGLCNYVYQNQGITLRRSSREQAKDGREIRFKDAAPGDLVFFKKGGQVFHVAVITAYDGNEMWVIHSTSSKGVILQEIINNSYWGPKIAFVRDVISR